MTTCGPSRRWLSDIAALHSAFADTRSVARLVRAAVTHARSQADFSDALEKKLVSSFTSATRKRIAREMNLATFPLADLAPLTGFRVEEIAGFRRPADCWIVWEHVDGVETRVPVNIKGVRRVANFYSGDFACALGPFLAWLTLPTGDIAQRYRGNPDELLFDLLSGKRKLVPGRDYYVWTIEDSGGPVTHQLRSLVSCHRRDGTGLAIQRHAQRNVVVYNKVVGPVIGPTVDIAREIALALLPKPGLGRLQVELLAATPASEQRAMAQKLRQLSDEQLVEMLLRSLD